MKTYLKTFSVQNSASEGPQRMRQDKRLGEAISEAAKDGVIDAQEVDRKIAPLFVDRGVIAKSEQGLVDLLDAARDGRRRAELDGQRIRLTPDAEKRLLHHRAALHKQVAPAGPISEAAFARAAGASAQAWYRRAVTEAYADIEADDPEAFDPEARARDMALADRIQLGGGPLYSLQPARAEDEAFYRDRAFFTPGGDPVPRDQVQLKTMNHEPEYAGQVLTSLLALDRRDGGLLAHLWTSD